MTLMALKSQFGYATSVEFEKSSIEQTVNDARVDAFIVSTEDGFSPLGSNLAFIASELGIPADEIRRLANWNRFKNPKVSLVALKGRRPESRLRGVILAASGGSTCYEQFAVHRYGRPFRDFYYNVTYESIAYANQQWGAQKLAISHLSGCGAFHEEIAACNVEALSHYCNSTPSALVKTLMFVGCCMTSKHFISLSIGLDETRKQGHREISSSLECHNGYDLIHLDWLRGIGNAPPKMIGSE